MNHDYGINIEKTVSITGHRILPKNFDTELVKKYLLDFINDGYNTFLIGMALGFDTLCFNILEELRKTHKIEIIACVPCIDQSSLFNTNDKKKYIAMLYSADNVIYVSDKRYTDDCMIKRNQFMINYSSTLFAYCIKRSGGSFYTVCQAEKNNKKVVFFK